MTGFDQPAYVLGPDGRFVWVNESCVELLGRPATELLWLHFQDLTHPDDHAGDRQRIGQLIAGKVRWLRVDER
ncbi:MAG: PAS domain-containing protein [Tepidimonas sp.]|uniref:PAS domain-containing protein n=1 Tax=Tepidimonas sp. TaxID=2002775 RepID=UPI00259F67EF|nr:PAS domain-containing protein [Tepidimonas sp.]MDM7456351.1 PAS domain-containing protein [Tepidimonas sp.]